MIAAEASQRESSAWAVVVRGLSSGEWWVRDAGVVGKWVGTRWRRGHSSRSSASKDPLYFGISASMLGLSPKSVSGFVGGDTAAGLLVEALASPLGKQLSVSRRSPRFSNMSRHLSPLSHHGS